MLSLFASLNEFARLIWNAPKGRILVGLALISALLATEMLPGRWSANEVNVFYLSYRWANPDAFGPYHSIFDDTYARTLPYLIIGSVIAVFGFEMAEIVLSLAQWFAMAGAIYWMVRAFGLGLLEALVGLALMILLNQSLFGSEWLFGGAETKTMAYTFVFLALGFAARCKPMTAMALSAIAVYLHFLVGGFWGLAILAFVALREGSVRQAIRPGALLLGLVLPLVVIIGWERLSAADVDASSVGMTINQIYAEFRNPHHTAPFANWETFYAHWFSGWVMHICFAIVALFMTRMSVGMERSVSYWLFGLNSYAVLALVLAFLDRDTHFLAAFYIFRPSALILLVTLFFLTRCGFARLPAEGASSARVAISITLGIAFAPPLYTSVKEATVDRVSIAETLTSPQADMVSWVKENTSSGDVVLIVPSPTQGNAGDTYLPWVGMEYLLERPTLVNFKFVPTSKTDTLRWYELLAWREAFSEGQCAPYKDVRVDYVIARSKQVAHALAPCGEIVWSTSEIFVIRIDAPEAPHPSS